VLGTTMDLSPHSADMIASGALQSFVEIVADDLAHDDTASIRYIGREDLTANAFGGRIVDGAFMSNRTRETTHPGFARPMLPIFVNADPVDVQITGPEIDLAPDGTGGYDGILRGGIRRQNAHEAAHRGLVQMFETEPVRHLAFLRGIDSDENDELSIEEMQDSVIGILLAADVQLFDGNAFSPTAGSAKPDSVSLAFGFHLTPCPEGACVTSPLEHACRNRVRDGDETDVDCGGSCQACWTDKTCAVDADCQSQACNGACAAPTCSDGVRDGFESDVDCGGVCPACAIGKTCAADRDCASDTCNAAIAALGTCT
jgi:hypothetical protein